MIKLRIAVFSAAFCFAANADGITLHFDFYYGGTKAADVTDVLTLSEDNNTYRLESYSEAVGLAAIFHGDVSLASSGEVNASDGLRTTMYYEKRGRREEQMAQRQTTGQWQFRRADEQRTEAVNEPLFDYLTAIYRSYILGAPSGGTLSFTDGWRLRDYVYTVIDEEEVETGMGKMNAILLTRDSKRGERKIWLAPSLNYLPVRLYVDEKGHILETVINSVSGIQ